MFTQNAVNQVHIVNVTFLLGCERNFVKFLVHSLFTSAITWGFRRAKT